MSTEDRVRAAARARTDLVRDIRPLEFPAEQPARVRRARRWLGWGAPIAAATLVTALALTLVLLRQAGGPQPGPATPGSGSSAAASGSLAAASIPRYYVALAYISSTSSRTKVVVGDDQTGRQVAVVNPSAGQSFYGVTAAADDRTFVVASYEAARQETTWYLLRLTPGAVHPSQLTKLPIRPVGAQVNGLALSPDGRELAVMWRAATTATNAATQLSVYSLSTGLVLGSWFTPGPVNTLLGVGANGVNLTWVNGDRSLDFLWGDPVQDGRKTIRSLDVTAGGHDLIGDSRLVLRLPAGPAGPASLTREAPCASLLVASDRAAICGSDSFGDKPGDGCSAVPPSFTSYSLITGKQLKVLYRYQGECGNWQGAQTAVLWTDPAGSHVIALIFLDLQGKPASAPADSLLGLVTNGHFTPLPALVTQSGFSSGAEAGQGGIAF